jgi:hypothetical protein
MGRADFAGGFHRAKLTNQFPAGQLPRPVTSPPGNFLGTFMRLGSPMQVVENALE